MNEHSSAHGPYQSNSEAMADTRAVYEIARSSSERGLMNRINEGQLSTALAATGIELGAYDKRIVGWLAGWEPEVVQVVIGWIERTHAQAPDLEGVA